MTLYFETLHTYRFEIPSNFKNNIICICFKSYVSIMYQGVSAKNSIVLDFALLFLRKHKPSRKLLDLGNPRSPRKITRKEKKEKL